MSLIHPRLRYLSIDSFFRVVQGILQLHFQFKRVSDIESNNPEQD